MMPEILVLTGPTGVGKTRLSILLAQALDGEIVSADSMQIYRGMDIGTAKPDLRERAGVPHHMLDVADPAEPYSVAQYVREAAACVDGIRRRGRLPILAGGTGLYIDSLLSGRSFAPFASDGALRLELGTRYDTEGGQALWRELEAVDPAGAGRIHPNDRKRVVRALEVYALTGRTITAHNLETQALPPRYRALKLGLMDRDRDALYRRIERRVADMVAQGLVAEVAGLLDRGLSPGSTAMQAIGYKEIARSVLGLCTLDEAVQAVCQESRRYAKRQLSWMRRDPDIKWIYWEKEPDFSLALQRSTAFFTSFDIIEPEHK